MSSSVFSRRFAKAVIGAGAALIVASSASAQGHFDALVYQQGGGVRIGAIDVDCFGGVSTDPLCDPTAQDGRVFEAEILANLDGTGFFGADDPGFFSPQDAAVGATLPAGADNFAPGAGHTIDIILAPNSPVPGASILYWDGLGPVSWSAVPNSEFFDIEGNVTSSILDGTNAVNGVVLDSPDGTGTFDTHPDWFLFGNGGLVDPTPGFYTVFGRTNIDGLASSAAWGIVFDHEIENEVLHEAAIDNVASFIPEPATGALFGIGLFALASNRRRQTHS